MSAPTSRAEQFRKTKSAATFVLDGVSYTILAASRAGGASADKNKNENEQEIGPISVTKSLITREERVIGPSDDDVTSLTPPPGHEGVTTHDCALRLRCMLSRLETDNVSRDDVMRSIQYAIGALEASRVCGLEVHTGTGSQASEAGEGEELSRVEAESVPSEVRDWLALTFTRQAAADAGARRPANEKPKFRSVANAIRAGLLVDRIYRRMTSLSTSLQVPQNVAALLKGLESWNFDVFALSDASEGRALRHVVHEVLMRHDLITKFKVGAQTLDALLGRLEQGYSKHANPYHNTLHAADVTQTLHYLISTTPLSVWLTDFEIFAAIFAALIHDYEHSGTTNTFHVNTRSEMALVYNDRAVLESHHVSAAFRLLREDELNILTHLHADEYREFRSLVIDIVLSTDLSLHFQQIKTLKTNLGSPETIDKTKALSMLVHCCDISHPAKDWELHQRWTEMLVEEFFIQGDREKALGLQISPLCDRSTTLVAHAQTGFIEFIVAPSFTLLKDLLGRTGPAPQQPGPAPQQPGHAPRQRDSTLNQPDFVSSSTAAAEESQGQTAQLCPASTDRLQNSSAVTTFSQSSDSWGGLRSKEGGLRRQEGERPPWEPCLAANLQRWRERSAAGWISRQQETSRSSAEEG